MLNKMWTQHKGFKAVAYSKKGELTCNPSTYAQCCNVLKHKSMLQELIENCDLEGIAKNEGLLYVLLYELLMGPNLAIRGGGQLKRTLMGQQEELRKALETLKPEKGDENDDDQEDNALVPRYVRVNTLKSKVSEIIEGLNKDNVPIYADAHVPDVLVMPPTSTTRGLLQPFVASNKVVLQDKSSCFSALCMVHGFDDIDGSGNNGGDFLDACAAPGNKTCHLAALVAAQQSTDSKSSASTIHALDKSKERFQMLQRRMKDLAPKNVKCHELDFLTISQETKPFANVSAILLDPSCSGSGMATRQNVDSYQMNRDPTHVDRRIQSLARFQAKALTHAMVEFEKVNRIVYSTCSLYIEENEQVVQRVLAVHGDDWRLVAPKCLTTWSRRGMEIEGLTPEQAQAMIRVDPATDETNGFFVACFERIPEDWNAKTSKKSATKAVCLWKLDIPKGLQVYQGQFLKAEFPKTPPSSSKKRKAEQVEEDAPASSELKGNKKSPKNPAPTKKEGTSSSSKKNQPDKKNQVDAKDTKSSKSKAAKINNKNDDPAKSATKRAKKQKWKEQQQNKRLVRLAKKQMTEVKTEA
jgi:putative methyltransferase